MQHAWEALLAQLEVQREMMQVQREVAQAHRVMAEAALIAIREAQGFCEVPCQEDEGLYLLDYTKRTLQ